MKIPKDISSRVLVISEDVNGKGGVVSIVKELANYYEQVNYLPSTNQSGSFSKLCTFITCLFKLTYSLVIGKIKVVHIHGASYGSFVRKMIIIYISSLFGAKTVYHIHSGAFNEFYTKYNKLNIVTRTLRKADILVVLSDTWRDFFSKIVDEKKIRVLNNIIPNPHIEIAKHQEKEVVSFLFLGVITETKGVFDLIKTIKQQKEALDGKAIFYIGGLGDSQTLLDEIEKNNLNDLVKYIGWIAGDDKHKYLLDSDVYVLPSYKEGLPVSILEAMSYGLTVLSTNVGGIPDLIKDDVNGYLISPSDIDALGNRIKYLVENRDVIERFGTVNLEQIRVHYPENVIPILTQIYTELLSK